MSKRRTHMLARLGGLALLLAAASPAGADVLLLKDGRILERAGMERTDAGIKIKFENGDVLVPHDLIEEAVLESGLAFEPKTPEEQEKAANGQVPFGGQWMARDKAEKLLAKRVEERKAAVAEMRDHMVWRSRHKEDTKHFAFEYTVSPQVYRYYADLMEAYYEDFAKTWKIKQSKELGRLRVCFYGDRENFMQTGGVSGGVLGYFRFVKPIELNFFYERSDPDLTEQVMYHEVNHYLQMLLKPEFNMPHFPGESIAEYYGAAKFDPESKSITTGHILEGRLAQVKAEIRAGEMIGLQKMLTTDGMYEHYSWGWTLVHWLMQDKKQRDTFVKFVKALVFDRKVRREPSIAGMTTVPMSEVWEQFKKFFKLKTDDDVKAFEAGWHKYVQEDLNLVSARGLADAAIHAERQGLQLKAKRLFSEAIEQGSTSPQVYLRYASYLTREREYAEALKLLEKAIEMAPLDARMYASLGDTLAMSGKKDDARKALQLAVELDPDDPWLASEVEMTLKHLDEK